MEFPINNVDLCAGEVRVTAPGLKKLAEIAVSRSRWDCERLLRDIQETNLDSEDCHRNGIHAFDSLAKGERNQLILKEQIK